MEGEATPFPFLPFEGGRNLGEKERDNSEKCGASNTLGFLLPPVYDVICKSEGKEEKTKSKLLPKIFEGWRFLCECGKMESQQKENFFVPQLLPQNAFSCSVESKGFLPVVFVAICEL